jgi:hypothetical protein
MSSEGLRKLPYSKTDEYLHPKEGWTEPPKDKDLDEAEIKNSNVVELNPNRYTPRRIIDVDPEAPEDTDLEIPAYDAIAAQSIVEPAQKKSFLPPMPSISTAELQAQRDAEDPTGLTPTRRALMMGGVATTGIGVAGFAITHENQTMPGTSVSRKIFHEEVERFGKKAALVEQVRRTRERVMDLRDLKHAQIGDLGRKILGIKAEPLRDKHGKVVHNKDKTIVFAPLPDEQIVRKDQDLLHLWDEKLIVNKHWTKLNEEIGREFVTSYGELLDSGDIKITDLHGFIEQADTDITNVRNATDWEKVAIVYGYEPKKLSAASLKTQEGKLEQREQKEADKKMFECIDALKTLAAKVDGKVLTSYAMTETMNVSGKADDNAKIFDKTLRVGGMEYVTRIPAIYDKEPSNGPYQATPLAMNIIDRTQKIKDAGGKVHTKKYKEYVGASKMNLAVDPKFQLPKEIQSPEGFSKFTDIKDHNTFAYLFAMHNIAETIDVLYRYNPKFVEEFKSIPKETLMEFISASHHKPHPSQAAMLALVRHLQKGKIDSLHAELPKDLQTYASKTILNHQSLGKYA